MNKSAIAKTRNLIAFNKLDDAIESLRKYPSLSKSHNNSLIILSKRLKAISEQKRNHSLPVENIQIEESRISEALLGLCDEIEKKEKGLFTLRQLINLFLIITVLSATLLCYKFLFDKRDNIIPPVFDKQEEISLESNRQDDKLESPVLLFDNHQQNLPIKESIKTDNREVSFFFIDSIELADRFYELPGNKSTAYNSYMRIYKALPDSLKKRINKNAVQLAYKKNKVGDWKGAASIMKFQLDNIKIYL